MLRLKGKQKSNPIMSTNLAKVAGEIKVKMIVNKARG